MMLGFDTYASVKDYALDKVYYSFPANIPQIYCTNIQYGGSKEKLGVLFVTGINLLHGAKFQRFLSGKSVFQNSKFQIREFHLV